MPIRAKILTIFLSCCLFYFFTFLTISCTEYVLYKCKVECCQTDLSSINRFDTPNSLFLFTYFTYFSHIDLYPGVYSASMLNDYTLDGVMDRMWTL